MLERPSEEEGEFEDWRSIKPAYTVCDGNNIKMIQISSRVGRNRELILFLVLLHYSMCV